eukprot:scaffold108378_cov54-Phaeocystis_antarctica.AAC.1
MFWVRSARALAPTAFSRARRLRRLRPTPSRLPARTSSRIVCHVPVFDVAARDGDQPAAELRHV